MPYIKKEDRGKFTYAIREIPEFSTPGELNYFLTEAVISYIDDSKGLSYQSINDVLGALEGAKQEFYRRVAAPYEDQKIKENGDVYDY